MVPLANYLSSKFRGSSANNKECFKKFSILNSSKYSSSQLCSHRTDFLHLFFIYCLIIMILELFLICSGMCRMATMYNTSCMVDRIKQIVPGKLYKSDMFDCIISRRLGRDVLSCIWLALHLF